MKYIKQFESVILQDEDERFLTAEERNYLHNLPYHRGDYVRVIDENGILIPFNGMGEHPIFRIKGISFQIGRLYETYSLYSGENCIGWYRANKLVKVHDYEIDAEKYNM
jgi:hypothetical protein